MQSLLVSAIKAMFEHLVLTPFLISPLCRVLGSFLKAFTKPSVFTSQNFSRLLFSGWCPYSLSCFIASSSCGDLIMSSANHGVYMILSGIFQEFLGVYQIPESQVSQRTCSLISFHEKEKKNTLKQWFFKFTYFIDFLKGFSPTEIRFQAEKCSCCTCKNITFSFPS